MNTFIIISLSIMWLGIFFLWLFRQSNSDLKVKDLRIPKKRFVQLALHWCTENLGTIKHPYYLKILYYRNNKYLGRYLFNGKQIVIYLFDNLPLNELTDTIIHEWIHHLQFVKRANEIDYNKQLLDIGYWENPYEVEARKLAKKYTDDCFKWVMNQI
jgi:hypothetical protein